ncbi:MAG: haloacid dehalogenase [Nitrospiraceae bacterium]|nr:MAG: haloacid dehalogenase [Nitrospiraceae bacterium]
MPVRFVYFDLDDTLLDHRQAEARALADVYAAHRAAFAPHPLAHVQATYHTHNAALWRDYAAGRLRREDVQHLRFARTLATLGLTALDPDALGEHYLARYAEHWSFLDGAATAFHAVADRFPVGLLTNGFAEIQHAKLDRFPDLRDRAQVIVISEEVGYLKPHPKLFEEATRRAGTAPEAILYVGDSYHTDVEGARRAGWQVAWYTTDDRRDEHVFRFHDWHDLLAHLDTFGV